MVLVILSIEIVYESQKVSSEIRSQTHEKEQKKYHVLLRKVLRDTWASNEGVSKLPDS